MDANDDQKAFWTENLGPFWVRSSARFDAAFEEVSNLVLHRAKLVKSLNVLDIGCGTGALTNAVAAKGARALGLDISGVMIEAARQAAQGGASFRVGDAQFDAFDDGPFDLVVSRFGVMFFADSVAAFANIRNAMTRGGRLVLAVWGDRKSNPWFGVPQRIATMHCGPGTPPDPLGPGPFAFEDPKRVIGILSDAGFANPQVEICEVRLSPTADVDEIADLVSRSGPAKGILDEYSGSEKDFLAIRSSVREELGVFMTDPSPGIPAKINVISAEHS